MNRRIVMERGNVVKIALAMNCTREMVSKALNFKKDSALARRIRFVAKEQYGGIDRRKGYDGLVESGCQVGHSLCAWFCIQLVCTQFCLEP